MYKPLPQATWRHPDTDVAHLIDSHGEPGPVVRKPLCEDTNYREFLKEETTIPEGVSAEGRTDSLDTRGFDRVNPARAISGDLCSECEKQYLDMLWRRPAEYPILEVTVETGDTSETYMVADIHLIADDDLSPCVQLVDELGRTRQLPMRTVREITPHSKMPVVY